ncbi:MAG: YihY/virulence factor BrkB family protein [Verrucomicrobiota bacterium]
MKRLRRIWRVLSVAGCKYLEIDGELRAASFAYYAIFALFPLVLLLISLGSLFWEQREVASKVLEFVGAYFPVNPNEHNVVISTIYGVVSSRKQAGAVAVLALAWSSLRFFQALVHGVNRAWGTKEYSWWRLPLANLVMVLILASTLLLGVLVPVIMKAIEGYWDAYVSGDGFGLIHSSFRIARLTIPSVVLFYGLTMFYKYAPRRKTGFSEVWLSAAIVTILLQGLSKGFVIYANNFGKFNALYGALGGVVAVLMWIYLSGSVIIFGGCLAAAQAEVAGKLTPEKDPESTR